MSGMPYHVNNKIRWDGQQCGDQFSDTASQPSVSYSDESGSHCLLSSHIRQRINTLYKEQLYTDVKFFINSARKQRPTISAHRAILAIGSKKFAEMLFGGPDASIKAGRPLLEVEINNISFEAFKNIIEYLYTDELFYENDILMLETLTAAQQYEIEPLVNQIESYFESLEITQNNACTMLQLATSQKMEAMKNRCIEFIQENTADVIQSVDFQKSPVSIVRTICKLQSLNLQSEVDLFEAVMKWVEANAQGAVHRRNLVEPLLKSIRFLAMKPNAFSYLMQTHSDILTTKEILDFVMYLTSPPESRNLGNLPSWCNKGPNRCFFKQPALSQGISGTGRNSTEDKVTIALRSFHRNTNLACLTSALELKCTGGKHVLKAVKLSFQDPVTDKCVIGLLILTVEVFPSGFRFVEKLKIQNSRDVRVPLTRNALARRDDTIKITAEATDVQYYQFLQFDEINSVSSNSSFTCNIGSYPKENRLFFISELEFAPQTDSTPKPHKGRFRSRNFKQRMVNVHN